MSWVTVIWSAVAGASLGIWCRYLTTNRIRANAKWRELFGFGEFE
jgi:hypothetical protein